MENAIDELKSQLNSQFAQLRDESQKWWEEEAEKMKLRWMTEEEQRRSIAVRDHQDMVNSICEQMKVIKESNSKEIDEKVAKAESNIVDRLIQMERKFERIMISNGKRVEDNSPPHSKINPEKKVRSESKDHNNDGRLYLPRHDCPHFTGDDVYEWLIKCQTYFELFQISESQGARLATLYFQGSALDWYKAYLIKHPPPDWTLLVNLVKRRFHRESGPSAIQELRRLIQVGSISEYLDQFEKTRARMEMEDIPFS